MRAISVNPSERDNAQGWGDVACSWLKWWFT